MPPQFDRHERRPTVCTAIDGPLALTFISGGIDAADVEAMAENARVARKTHPRLAIVTICYVNIPMPDRAVRERAAAIAKDAPGGGIDIVVLGMGGLFGTASRAVLTGIYLLSGKLNEHRVVPDTAGAATLIADALSLPVARVREALANFETWAKNG